MKGLRFLLILAITLLMANNPIEAQAAVQKINTNLPKTTFKTNESFSLNYYLIIGTRRVTPPSGTVILKQYSDSTCSQIGTQIGVPLDLSMSTNGNYSFSSAGTYYVKPEITGYTGSCMGPITVLSANVVFEKLTLRKVSQTQSNVQMNLRWENLAGQLAAASTSKASFSLYSNSTCSSRITSFRTLSVSPKNGQLDFSFSRPSLPSVYAKAISSPFSSSCLEIPVDCPAGQSLIEGNCGLPFSDASGSGYLFTDQNPELEYKKYTQCNESYHLTEGFSCEPNQIQCTNAEIRFRDLGYNIGFGTKSWNGTSFESCILTECDPGSHISPDGLSCDSEVLFCSISGITGRKPGQRVWNSSVGSYSFCQPACSDGQVKNNFGFCVDKKVSCQINVSKNSTPELITGERVYNLQASAYTDCVITSCPMGYHPEYLPFLDVPNTTNPNPPGWDNLVHCVDDSRFFRNVGGFLGHNSRCFYEKWENGQWEFTQFSTSSCPRGFIYKELDYTFRYTNGSFF